jgi:hypothetical protein
MDGTRKTLRRRNSFSFGIEHVSYSSDSEQEYSEEDEEDSVKKKPDCRFEYLRTISECFCNPSNAGASMRGSRERLLRGEVSYRGLQINHDNNEDLLFIHIQA